VKKRHLLLLAFLPFLFCATNVDAKVLTVTKEGGVVWNVLSDEDSIALGVSQEPGLEVKAVYDQGPVTNAKISLSKEDGGAGLTIISESGEKEMRLENTDGDLVEIEARPMASLIKIGLIDGIFTIRQEGVLAKTDYAISIESQNAKLTLAAPTGQRYLYVLPQDAINSVLRAKTLTNVDASKDIRIVEEDGDLVYKLSGEKHLNLFNLYDYPVELEASISATTGEIVKTNAPIWLSLVSYLLS
jgi:hypothetical protein